MLGAEPSRSTVESALKTHHEQADYPCDVPMTSGYEQLVVKHRRCSACGAECRDS